MLGSGGSKPTAFDRYHPAVAFGYFACMLAFSMAAMQPVYLALSLAAALCVQRRACGACAPRCARCCGRCRSSW